MWKLTSMELPPENVPVKTISPGGEEQTLIRKGNLWWTEDEKTYVYYTPERWKLVK